MFFNICGLIGTVISAIGLSISLKAYKKIKNVHTIILNKRISSIIVKDVESIMRIREDMDLSEFDKSKILKTLDDIELLIQRDFGNNKILKQQIKSIHKEVKKEIKNIKIIKSAFKILKESLNVSEVNK